MQMVTLFTFLAGIVYVYLGYFGLKLDRRARLNQIFFLLCIACGWWAFCIAFMFPAANYASAWGLFRLSSPGWCLGPPLILHFSIYLTKKQQTPGQTFLTLIMYIPGFVFTVLGMTVGVTSKFLLLKSFGWDNVPATDSPVYWAYVVYYLLCVGISIFLVLHWGCHSCSKREQEQAKIFSSFSFLGLLLAGSSETLLALLGITSIPKIPVIMWLFWAFGMWIDISKYRLMILSPEIATSAIVASITDMLIMLNPKGLITMVNQSVITTLGYSSDELLHKPAHTIFANTHLISDVLQQMVTVQASSLRLPLDYQSKDGEPIPIMLSCSAIIDSFDELAGIVLVAQDLRPTRLLESQNTKLETITNDLLETNCVLQNRNLQIKNILNNVGQGFLSFGKDLLIDNEYSEECINIFNKKPQYMTLTELLFPDDHEQKEFMEILLKKIFSSQDQEKIKLYMPLLPSELELNNRTISLAYRLVPDEVATVSSIITILTDISEKRVLEEQMEEEKNTLRMMVKTIVYYDDFIECVEDFTKFTTEKLDAILDSSAKLDEKVSEIYRNIHTFKGNFSQFDTIHVVKKLHTLESVLAEAMETNTLTETDLQNIRQELSINEWLNEDIAVITQFLGQDFWQNKDIYKVDKQKLQEIEEKMLHVLPHKEYALLLPYIQRLRYKSFKEMLKSYPDYVLQLAERLGKSITPFVIEGDDFLVDHDYYHFFARSLIHVFRNIVDHGIEYMDERILLGKGEMGTVRCTIGHHDNHISLHISDDGAGIDTNKIKTIAIATGKYSEEELSSYSDEQVLQLIFDENFSTSENVSMISGRGVGLSAVKAETERISGQVVVKTILGEKNEFIFDLPIRHSFEIPEISLPNILTSIIRTMEQFALCQLDLCLKKDFNIRAVDKVYLHQYTAMINIRGIVDGIIVISYNETLVKTLANLFGIKQLDLKQEPEILEDITAEVTNIIIGNSLKEMGAIEDLVTIGMPTVTSTHDATIKQSKAQIYTCELKNNNYIATTSFIPN